MKIHYGVILGACIAPFLAISGAINPALREPIDGLKWPHAVLDGTASHAFGAKFDEELWFRKPSVELWSAATYALLKEARDGAVVGNDHWFFTKEEFATPHLDGGIARAVKAAKEAQAKLSARGINFVVAVVPAKARIYSDELGRRTWPPVLTPVYDDFLSALGQADIAYIDLRPSLLQARARGLAYFKTDTHWTPLGAEAAAGAISQSIIDQGLSPELPGASISTIKYEGEKPHHGDILNFLPLGPFEEELNPPPDRLRKPVLETLVADGAGLLGDQRTPVVLAGTSYSADERWGFAGFLERDLRAGVVNVSEEAEGPYTVLKKLLSDSTTLTENQPSLVVWEFPERDIWTLTPDAKVTHR